MAFSHEDVTKGKDSVSSDTFKYWAYTLHDTHYTGRWLSIEKRKEKRVVVCCSGEHHMPDVIGGIALRHRLGDRGNVVMTRLNDVDLERIDALVEVEVFKSRSEAAAFFIKEGIQARSDLVQKVMPTVDKIRELRKQAKESLGKVEESSESEGT